jgi:hypothetical protein
MTLKIRVSLQRLKSYLGSFEDFVQFLNVLLVIVLLLETLLELVPVVTNAVLILKLELLETQHPQIQFAETLSESLSTRRALKLFNVGLVELQNGQDLLSELLVEQRYVFLLADHLLQKLKSLLSGALDLLISPLLHVVQQSRIELSVLSKSVFDFLGILGMTKVRELVQVEQVILLAQTLQT